MLDRERRIGIPTPDSPGRLGLGSAHLFAGPGEMCARARALDWSATPLGPVERWPVALCNAVQLSLDSGFAMCVYAGPEFVLIYNDPFARALGAAKHPWALGRPAREVWAEAWDRVGPELAQVGAGGAPTRWEEQAFVVDRDGRREETFWTYGFSPVRDTDGRVVAVHNVATETTDRVRMEGALREREQRLARMINVPGVGVLTFDAASGTLVDANDAFLRMTGYTREQIATRELTWRTMTPPEYVAISEAQMEGFAITGRIGPYEKEYLLADGTRSWMLFAGAALGGGEVVEYCVDVSDRKRAEAALEETRRRLEEALGAVRMAYWDWDPATDRIVAGPSLGDVFGLRAGETLTSSAVGLGFVHPEDRPHHRARVEGARTGGTGWHAEFRIVRPRDGEIVWLEERASVTRDPVTGTPHVTGLVWEITARKRAEAAAERARAEAEAANRAKSEFLAVMSHELRTPLNAIGGYAELLELGIRGPVTPHQREDLGRIRASQRHLLGLINEVLNYARLESGTVQYELVPVQARDTLADASALVAPQAQAKGLMLHVSECPPDLVVLADAEKLRQILVNLLSNAVKFTDRGGRVVLACRVPRGAGASGCVEFTVRDTGIGIAADQTERIFDPFVQVRANLTRTAEGTGLGLAISRDLARGMGGDLTVASVAGEGATFTLTLPQP